MKTTVYENENGLNLHIEPETIQEMAKLLRFAKNAKAEKPSVTMHFGNEPVCTIWMGKITPSKQSSWIRPNNK